MCVFLCYRVIGRFSTVSILFCCNIRRTCQALILNKLYIRFVQAYPYHRDFRPGLQFEWFPHTIRLFLKGNEAALLYRDSFAMHSFNFREHFPSQFKWFAQML